ncbi:MMPL family transporter, partial [candidate division KSB3 bacterium]|nr:MMPL family transporter [candidate division KSB3 bacterium]MBD3325239.1 MMPL family transporter [candidate division KSB3 bacterium]
IPLSVIPAFIGLRALGYTFNLMTMGGLALGIGMLVDNAVVVIENTFRHLEEGRDVKQSAQLGGTEVQMAITSSTLTTVAVFLPMVLASGLSGKLARPLALTVVVALFSSLFVALTLIPMISTLILDKTARVVTRVQAEQGRFYRFRRWYRHLLFGALTHRKTVLSVAGLIFLAGVLLMVFVIGAEFMPSQDVPMIFAMTFMPVGTSLEETDRVVRQIETIVLDQPEVLHVSTFTGLSESTKFDVGGGRGAAGVNESQIMIRLTDKGERTRSTEAITEAIRSRLPRIRGAKFEFIDMGQAMQGGWGDQTPVALKLYGKEIDTLKTLAEEIVVRIQTVEGLRDVDMSLKEGKPELQIEIDREQASQLGISTQQIARTIKTSMLGTVASKFRIRGEEYDIRVRFLAPERDSIADLRNITILSPAGFQVPLYQIARIRQNDGPVKITRENQARKVTVTANTFGRDMKRLIADIKARLADLPFPSGYFLEYGGTYKEMQEAFVTLGKALIVAILLVYMVMAAQFESFLQPFIIMFTVPLAVIGVVIGLLLFGYILSVPVFMGVIILTGVVVNNSIVMIDYVNHLRWHGIEARQAILEGTAVRLRPILITTLTTCLGMLPMALSRAEGSEMRSPMAVAICFGLFFAMGLTLFVIPVVYSILSRISFKGLTRKDLHALELDHRALPHIHAKPRATDEE